jgi:uncharacterized membrane protein
MPFETAFIVLSFLGIIDAGYLAFKHTQKKPLVCPINHNCSQVTESAWSTMFGIRNEYLGVAYYLSLCAGGVASFVLAAYQPPIYLLLFGATVLGVMYSVFLVALQAFVIKNYCFYCMISALLSILLFLNSAKLFFG